MEDRNLDLVFTNFVLPKLIKFKKEWVNIPINLTDQIWNEYLEFMIEAFTIIRSNNGEITNPEDYEKIERGLKLFAKYYLDLWY